ncbi:MAG: histidine--tRNA ligase [Bacteroidetes bacterium]|jgi:histidyl-tRNA synthetase|nr:histidine--tRNA ligase [Bacteroidota bacterium]
MKPSLLKGTRDFLPKEMLRRAYIFETIQKVFVSYGFQPIETPALERLSTLMGKYGDEGDQLLFKIINNGDFLSKVSDEDLQNRDLDEIIYKISKRGLRYDLTVPLARYVAQHQNDLAFPFKRYQIQPVWRADRPQKGRYQEFYQCDADVVGSDSLLYEIDFVQIYSRVFRKLNLPVQIKANHRGLLASLIESVGLKNQFEAVTISIDKWDKIGRAGVKKELNKLTDDDTQIENLLNHFENGTLDDFERLLKTEQGKQAIRDLKYVFEGVAGTEAEHDLDFSPKLARGLNYYTGCIFEVVSTDGEFGSIGGGGRYANLTEVFGMKNMPGVGISFGAERIYDYLEKLSLFPEQVGQHIDVLFCCFDEKSHQLARKYAELLREIGQRVDVYPDWVKLGKQLKYADHIGAPYVAVIGEQERQQESINLKQMSSGEQKLIRFQRLVAKLNKGESYEDQFSEK